MANKAINIKQSEREREVGRDWGAKGAWQQKDVIWQLAFWTLSLWLWFCSPARLPATPTQRQVHWCVRIFYNNFPRVPPFPLAIFLSTFFWLFPSASRCEKFSIALASLFDCFDMFFSHIFPSLNSWQKFFGAHTHTQRQTDRQKSSQLSLWFSMCAWQRLVFQILHSTCSLLLLLPLRAPVLGVILDLTEKWKFNAFAKHNFRKFLPLLLI